MTVSVLLECPRVMSDSLSAATFKCRASERCLFHKWPQSRLNAELSADTDQINSVITNGPAIPRQPRIYSIREFLPSFANCCIWCRVSPILICLHMETAGACYAMLLGDKLNLVGCAVLSVKERPQEPNTHFLLRS